MGEGLNQSFGACLGDSALFHSVTPALTSWARSDAALGPRV